MTGGTRGIGLAISAELVARGVHVLATGRSDTHFEDARDALKSAAGPQTGPAPGHFECAVADVRDYPQVERAMAQAVERFGGLDILVNNAGVGIFVRRGRSRRPTQWRETHRHEPDRRVLLLPRRDSAPAAARRRLDHQHQQPGREELRSPAARRTAPRRPA